MDELDACPAVLDLLVEPRIHLYTGCFPLRALISCSALGGYTLSKRTPVEGEPPLDL